MSALAELTPDTQARALDLLALASQQGTPATVTSTVRSCAEQDALYAKGRTAPGPAVTGVRGCRSWHVQGRALDIYVGSWEPEDYAALGLAWEKWGGIWGGRWGDHVHFEWHPGITIDQVCPPPGTCGAPSLASAVGKGMAVGGIAVGLYVLWTTQRGRR